MYYKRLLTYASAQLLSKLTAGFLLSFSLCHVLAKTVQNIEDYLPTFIPQNGNNTYSLYRGFESGISSNLQYYDGNEITKNTSGDLDDVSFYFVANIFIIVICVLASPFTRAMFHAIVNMYSSGWSKNQVLTSINAATSIETLNDNTYNTSVEYSSLTSVNLPPTVTSISEYEYWRCHSLESINLPPTLTSISDGAFNECRSLTSIILPPSITLIGNHAFAFCSSLTSINIPSTVISIGDGAFRFCSSLTSITLPPSVTSIGECVFEGCISLESITLPPTVKLLGKDIFYACSSLNSINLPSSPASNEFHETGRLFTEAIRAMMPQNTEMTDEVGTTPSHNLKVWSRMRNENDRLPLTTAAAISLEWTDMKHIFDANKVAIYETDAVTGLPLFMLAAASLNSDIESVYRLLAENPAALMLPSVLCNRREGGVRQNILCKN